MGPIPARPSLYPPNSTYYRVPITFEVELLDARRLPASGETARAAGGEGVGS